ncbi:hypothetical protein PIB30_087138 [Stylosanthes scabra]|uniref:Uncharacterized protein n=1 Tax=Stylosanthes scabra TaxID=79078 RepID=A0ABU6STJ8_9FABA|nr:hypothetical protein [Stylosanthes scabra]
MRGTSELAEPVWRESFFQRRRRRGVAAEDSDEDKLAVFDMKEIGSEIASAKGLKTDRGRWWCCSRKFQISVTISEMNKMKTGLIGRRAGSLSDDELLIDERRRDRWRRIDGGWAKVPRMDGGESERRTAQLHERVAVPI